VATTPNNTKQFGRAEKYIRSYTPQFSQATKSDLAYKQDERWP